MGASCCLMNVWYGQCSMHSSVLPTRWVPHVASASTHSSRRSSGHYVEVNFYGLLSLCVWYFMNLWKIHAFLFQEKKFCKLLHVALHFCLFKIVLPFSCCCFFFFIAFIFHLLKNKHFNIDLINKKDYVDIICKCVLLILRGCFAFYRK